MSSLDEELKGAPWIYPWRLRDGSGVRVAPKCSLQSPVKARRNRLLLVSGRRCGRHRLSLRALQTRVPKLDVQPIDLLDQHQNRATAGGGLRAIRLPQTLAPTPECLELVFV